MNEINKAIQSNDVTPWKKAMIRIFIGVALSGMTLHVGALDVFFPGIGLALSLLGFRAMQQECSWYKKAFLANVVRLAYFMLYVILRTTIWYSKEALTMPLRAASALNMILLFVEYYCLWKGLQDTQLKQKAEAIPGSGTIVGLMLWTILMGFLGSAGYEGLILPLAMLIAYILLLRNWYRFIVKMDEAGCTVETHTRAVSDQRLILLLAGILLVGCVCGYTFGSRYPMKWTEIDRPAGAEKTKENLKNLGFPEEVLQDLTAQDLSACVEATQVITEQDTYDTDNHLRFTGVAVKLGDALDTWVIFHHFTWTETPGFPGTESLTLWPTWREAPEGWSEGRKVTGRLLCEQNGVTCTAPYYTLTEEMNTTDTMFWGQQTRTDVIAAFSYPSKAENARGYLTYTTTQQEPDTILSSRLTYTHQHTRLQYPARTATEASVQDNWADNRAFTTTQTGFQFYPEIE